MGWFISQVVVLLVFAHVIYPAYASANGGTPARHGQKVTFTAHVSKGQQFNHKIADNLVFELRPSTFFGKEIGAWIIRIGDPTRDDKDYAWVVTPPFHGPNNLYLFGSYFRNADNSGPNDGSVNAPGEVRHFRFVTDHASYQEASGLVECLLHGCAEMDFRHADAAYQSVLRRSGTGTLTITDLKLGNLIVGQLPSIESITFIATLELPGRRAKTSKTGKPNHASQPTPKEGAAER
jgi:hypothetical protein